MSLLRILLGIFVLSFSIQMIAQKPFVCRGTFYLTLGLGGNPSVNYEVVVDPLTGDIQFDPLDAPNSGAFLNSIGYRSTDNFIYGIDPGTFVLYQIDSTGQAFSQGFVGQGVNTNLSHIAGDITPDGKELVLLQASTFGDQALIIIDLDNPSATKTTISLTGLQTRCADIAFNPITGRLYGFDGFSSRLVEINLQTGTIGGSFPSSNVADMMGAIYFDAFGNLYGYGRRSNGSQQDGFFSVNKNSGEVTLEGLGPNATRNDGCSCPYTVELREWVGTFDDIVPCTTVPIEIEIANTSGKSQSELTFEHYFPNSFVIQDIQFLIPATITEGGIGTNYFIYEDLTLPPGIHKMTVWVELLPDASGTHSLQSVLSGLSENLGETAISDNPFTILQDDPAVMVVEELEIDLTEDGTTICPGDVIELEPGIFGVDYLWSDGSTEPHFTVTEGGTYAVTVTSGCDVAIETVTVMEIQLRVDLQDSYEIILGDEVDLLPFTIPVNGNYIYTWESENGDLPCTNCQEPTVQPLFDGYYSVHVSNGMGCQDTAMTYIRVIKDRNIYFPNAFSPNDDGFNEFFYPQGKNIERVLNMQIFDRWGSLVFEKANFETNDVGAGWDGEFEGQKLPIGVYVYKADIEFLDREVFTFTGDVTLLR